MKKAPEIRIAFEALFDAHIALVICEWSEFLGAAKEFLQPEKFSDLQEMSEHHGNNPITNAVQFPMKGGGSVIWSRPGMPLSILAHEFTHAGHYLLKLRDTPLTEATEEVYAYLQQFLVRELWEV